MLRLLTFYGPSLRCSARTTKTVEDLINQCWDACEVDRKELVSLTTQPVDQCDQYQIVLDLSLEKDARITAWLGQHAAQPAERETPTPAAVQVETLCPQCLQTTVAQTIAQRKSLVGQALDGQAT